MNDIELKQVMGGLSAAMLNSLSRAAGTILLLGQMVGTAIRKFIKR